MSLVRASDRLQLPEALQSQLYDFRKRVWSIKMIEAVSGALFGVVIAFLVLFGLDRVWETSALGRDAASSPPRSSSCAIDPAWPPTAGFGAIGTWNNWPACLSRKHPRVGDQLLGIIELVRSDFEQARSRTSVRGRHPTGRRGRSRNAISATPFPIRGIACGLRLAAVPVVGGLALLAVFPAAGTNAWARLLAPWRATPRYTFAAVEPLPERIVVAHGEPFSLTVQPDTADRQQAARRVGPIGRPATGRRRSHRRRIQLRPAAADRSRDARRADRRLAAARAGRADGASGTDLRRSRKSRFPNTWACPKCRRKTSAAGPSRRSMEAASGFSPRPTATWPALKSTGTSRRRRETRSPASPIRVQGAAKLEFRWQDHFGLTGQQPFTLSITGREDEAPTLVCEGLPRQKVVLDSEMLSFKVRAHDDFGVKRVGLEWQGVADRDRPENGKRRTHSGRGRQRQGEPERQRHVLGQIARHRAAAAPRTRLRRGLFSGAEARLLAHVRPVRAQRRTACDLADRAIEQMAPPVFGRPRSRNAALRDEQAAPRPDFPRARPARDAAPHRVPGGRRVGQRPAIVAPGGDGRRPRAAGDAQPGVRRRPPREVGRDAANPQRHRRQPHALRGRPAQTGIAGGRRGPEWVDE